jgi:hypothetical protein
VRRTERYAMAGRKRASQSQSNDVQQQDSSSKRPRKQPVRYEAEFQSSEKSNTSNSRNAEITYEETKRSLPTRLEDGTLCFDDFPEFRPNLTPKEVLQLGSFGGTYFRSIHSSITGESYQNVWKEFPEDWFSGLDIKTQVCALE